MTIPNCGFNESFTITDALPSTWNNGVQCRDTYKDGSLKILMQGTEIGSDLLYSSSGNGIFSDSGSFQTRKTGRTVPTDNRYRASINDDVHYDSGFKLAGR